MGNRQLEMNGKLIKEVLRHKAQNKTTRQSANELKVHHSTVQRWLNKALEKGLTWENAKGLSPEEISQRLKGRKGPCTARYCPIDLDFYRKQMSSQKNLCLEDCWQNYVEQAKQSGKAAFSRSSFYVKLSSYLKQKEFTLVMPQQRFPGQYLEIDFAGDVIKTSEGKQFRVFVAVLSWSKLIYAKVVPDATTQSWIEGIMGAFEYIEGLPEVILSDNDAALVAGAQRGNKKLVKCFQDFLDYYEIEPEVARVRHPRDKGLCENAVKIVERSFIHRLSCDCVKTIGDAQLLCQQAVEQINARPMQESGVSRMALFLSKEKKALRALKLPAFTTGTRYKECKIGKDGCIKLDGHRYSVPYLEGRTAVKVAILPEAIVRIYNLSESECLAEFPHYEKGQAHDTEGFKHIRLEHLHPKYVQTAQRLDKTKTTLSQSGQNIKMFTESFCKANKKNPENVLADKLNRIIKLIDSDGCNVVEKGCEHCIGIGEINIDSLEKFVAFNPEGRRPPAAEENTDALLRGEELLNN